MTPELLAAVRERDNQEGRSKIEIWPDMANAVLTFFSLDTQWRRGHMGELLGLDYSVIKPTADLLGLTLDPQAFHDLRVLEIETLRIVRAKRRG